MSFAERGENPLTLKELAEIQKEFEKGSWDASNDPEEKFRHLFEHLIKAAGKMATVVERREHGLDPETVIIDSELVPDLLYYALAIAEIQGVDLQEAYLERLDANQARVAGWVEERDKKD